MTSKIIVDYREKKLIDKLKSSQKISNILEISNLDIADIIISFNQYSLYIERKTIPDLIASIKDGRYKEQKMRLQAHQQRENNSQIMYVVEGPNKFRHQGEENLYYGAWISIVLRDKVPLFRTCSLDETSSFIVRLLMRLQKNANELFNSVNSNLNSINLANNDVNENLNQNHSGNQNENLNHNLNHNDNINQQQKNEECKIINLDMSRIRNKTKNETDFLNKVDNKDNEINNSSNNLSSTVFNTENTKSNVGTNTINDVNIEYLTTIATKKKNNINPNNWEIISLSNIPGISPSVAEQILKKYHNIGCLYNKYSENSGNDDENEKLLSSIELKTKTGKTRKLGLVASKKIYQFIYKKTEIN